MSPARTSRIPRYADASAASPSFEAAGRTVAAVFAGLEQADAPRQGGAAVFHHERAGDAAASETTRQRQSLVPRDELPRPDLVGMGGGIPLDGRLEPDRLLDAGRDVLGAGLGDQARRLDAETRRGGSPRRDGHEGRPWHRVVLRAPRASPHEHAGIRSDRHPSHVDQDSHSHGRLGDESAHLRLRRLGSRRDRDGNGTRLDGAAGRRNQPGGQRDADPRGAGGAHPVATFHEPCGPSL